MRIKLASDTISKEELNHLSTWILKGNQLTKGDETRAFEKEFRDYLGIKYAVNTNSGSSSNLLMTYALVEGGYLKNKKVIAPSVSWVTTVSPLLQMGFEVSLCDCDPHDLGLDISHLEDLCKKEKPSLMILVHVLGHSNNMKEIHKICKKNGVKFNLQNRLKFFNKSFINIFNQKFDLIVSNPPYIMRKDIKNLSDDIKRYEPRIALDGGNDGLDLIKKVIYKSKVILKINGTLALEIGNGQIKKVSKILTNNNFRTKNVIKDYKNNVRCIIANKNK